MSGGGTGLRLVRAAGLHQARPGSASAGHAGAAERRAREASADLRHGPNRAEDIPPGRAGDEVR